MIPLLAPLAFAAAATCSAPAELLAPPTADVAVTSKFDATVWGGQQVHTRSTITFPAGSAAAKVTYVDDDAGKTTQAPVTVTPCGAASNDKLNAAMESYNNALALALNAPGTVAAGASWNGTINLYVSQTQTLEVPVKITVAKKDAAGTLLQATGRASGTLTQYGTPFDLTYQAAALFQKGRLMRADSAAQEAIQAGPQSQTMTFAWSVARKG